MVIMWAIATLISPLFPFFLTVIFDNRGEYPDFPSFILPKGTLILILSLLQNSRPWGCPCWRLIGYDLSVLVHTLVMFLFLSFGVIDDWDIFFILDVALLI